jgi:hypothetical protein
VNKGERRKGLSLEKDPPTLTTSSDYAGLCTSKHDVTVRSLLRTSENPLPRTSVNRVLKPMSVGLAPFWEMALD